MIEIEFLTDTKGIMYNYGDSEISQYIFLQNFSFRKEKVSQDSEFVIIETVDQDSDDRISLCPSDTIILIKERAYWRYRRMPCFLYFREIN